MAIQSTSDQPTAASKPFRAAHHRKAAAKVCTSFAITAATRAGSTRSIFNDHRLQRSGMPAMKNITASATMATGVMTNPP